MRVVQMLRPLGQYQGALWRRHDAYALFELAPFALGDCQEEEKTLNFWNRCHIEIVNFVGAVVTLRAKSRDLIVNDLEFCS
jgi:hypothetical protein